MTSGRRKWLRPALELLGFLALFLAVRGYQQKDAISGVAPPFAAGRLEGGHASLEEYRGRPVVLHFWATWCGVCRAMEDKVRAGAAGDVPIVRIASRSGSARDVGAYLASRGEPASGPFVRDVLLDPDGTIAARYGVRAFPTTFWLDGEGRIEHVEVGYTTALGLRVRAVLAGRGI